MLNLFIIFKHLAKQNCLACVLISAPASHGPTILHPKRYDTARQYPLNFGVIVGVFFLQIIFFIKYISMLYVNFF